MPEKKINPRAKMRTHRLLAAMSLASALVAMSIATQIDGWWSILPYMLAGWFASVTITQTIKASTYAAADLLVEVAAQIKAGDR